MTDETDPTVEIKDAEIWRAVSNRTVLTGGLLSLGMGAVATVLSVLFGAGALAGAVFFVPLLTAAIMLRYRLARPSARGRTLRVSREGITDDQGFSVARNEIESGFAQPEADQTRVALEHRNRRVVEFRVKSAQDARELLTALGLDATRKTATFRGASALHWNRARSFASVAATLGITLVPGVYLSEGGERFLAVVLACYAMIFPLAILSALPSRVTVGTDAVVISWLGMQRRIALADVARVEPLRQKVRLHRKDGTHIDFATERKVGTQDVAVALANRIEEALAARSSTDTRDEARALSRANRPFPQWVDALRRGLSQTPGFRSAALVPERLWRLLEDANAEGAQRAAAAVSLAEQLDPAGRERIRVCAEAAATPALRVALETIASDQRDDVPAALEALEREEKS